jgi:glycosyltransferase involved in cell wall biosynthesis
MARLLFATQFEFFPEALGGAQISTHRLLSGLVDEGWEVAAVCRLSSPFSRSYRSGLFPALSRGRLPELAATDDTLGYRCWRLVGLPQRSPLRKLDRRLVRRSFARCLEVFQPDVVLGDSSAGCPLLRQALARGYPCIYLARSIPAIGAPSIIPHNLFLAGNSPYTAAILEAISGQPIEVVRPMVYAADYRVERRDPRFVTFINPVPQKGVSIAVEVARRMPGTRFLFIKGKWPLASPKTVEAMVRPARDLPNVEVWEHLLDMREVYRVTRVLLAPSQFLETFGRVIIEAQTNGIPVVAARVAGIPDTLGEGGVLVDPKHDVDAYVKALQELEQDPAHYARLSNLALENSHRPELAPGRQLRTFVRFVNEQVLGAAGASPAAVREAQPTTPG